MTLHRPNPLQFESLPRYRAPQEHGQWLVTPQLSMLLEHHPTLASVSARVATDGSLSFGGYSLAKLRAQARADALRAALAHTSQYRSSIPAAATSAGAVDSIAWLVAGHQPELFHPGVWFKNFLLSQSAAAHNLLPLNLVIDNDLCRSPGIKVPTRDHDLGQKLRPTSVLFDAPSAGMAWECRALADKECFASFPSRVKSTLAADVPSPLVEKLWPLVTASLGRNGKLGLALAEGRHALEAELGLQTLELPLSQLCNQAAFARFSLEVFSRLERFQQSYNTQRAAYRAANHIRNEAHPVPGLTAKSGWLEAPWWVYRYSAPARRKLFVRRQADNLLLSDHAGWQALIEGPLDGDDAVAQWQEIGLDDVLLRPRALITTMFARLIISDYFMHGIGGGKYDQITDAIIQDFWGTPPPPMCVATATLTLPIKTKRGQFPGQLHPGQLIGANTKDHQLDQMRQLRYHAEEFIAAPSDEAHTLIQRKHELLKAIPPRGEKWQWHREMTRINQRLAELTIELRKEAEESLQALAEEQRELKLAKSRDYSFCLFELPRVAEDLQRMAGAALNPAAGK